MNNYYLNFVENIVSKIFLDLVSSWKLEHLKTCALVMDASGIGGHRTVVEKLNPSPL